MQPHPLPIVGRYAGLQVELSGDHAAITALVTLLSTAAAGRSELLVPEGSAHPWAAFLRSITLEPVADGLILIARNDDDLVFRGSVERLQFLGECIETLLGAEGGEHLHIEHYDEHPYLLAESLALIVTLR